MANPFRRADRHGAPSIRPTPPESAETPMPVPDPIEHRELPVETRDLPVNRPTAPPSAETPMEPPSAPSPTNDKPPAKD